MAPIRFLPGGKVAGTWREPHTPLSIQVNNSRSYISTSPYAFMMRLLITAQGQVPLRRRQSIYYKHEYNTHDRSRVLGGRRHSSLETAVTTGQNYKRLRCLFVSSEIFLAFIGWCRNAEWRCVLKRSPTTTLVLCLFTFRTAHFKATWQVGSAGTRRRKCLFIF